MSLARHTGYNLAGSVTPILVSLATLPLFLHTIGLERYGFISICWMLLGYFGLFDLGIGRAVSQRIASLGSGDADRRSRIMWAGLGVSAVLSVIAGILLLIAGHLALTFIQFESAAVKREAMGALPFLALTVPMTLLSGVMTGALIGRERFGVVSLTEATAAILATLAPLAVALWITPSLPWLLAAALASRGMTTLFALGVCIRAIPLGRPKGMDRAEIKPMLGFGAWVSISNTVGPLLVFSDRFVIGGLIGAAAVSLYVIPFNLVMRLTILPEALARTLFPRFARAAIDHAEALGREAVYGLSLLLAPVAVLLIALLPAFLTLWVGKSVATASSPVAHLLIPGLWINCLALIALMLLQARSRPHVAAKAHAAELIPYCACLYLAIRYVGIDGAALVWTARATVDAIILFHFSGIGLAALRRLSPVFAILWAAALAARMIDPAAPSYWLVMISALILVTGASYAAIDPALRSRLKRGASQLFSGRFGRAPSGSG